MTVDIEKLEALAKAAKSGGAEWSDLTVDTERMYTAEGMLVELYEFATPAVLLELIASKALAEEARDLYMADKKRLLDELNDSRAEVAGRKTGYEAYERVNAELRAECEALRDAAAVSAMRIKELDLLFGRYILAMRAAVIEDEHGKTETAGMDWIFNSLVGPGQLPPEGETDAQAYFDREIVAVDNGMQEVLAFHDQRRAAKSKEAAQ